jgi:hypothetical protein
MKRSRITAALAAIVAVVAVGSTGAALGASPNQSIDLSSPAAIDNYLLSKGFDPSKFVKQLGANNYAGPNCPGATWNCTTAPLVIQTAMTGGANGFQCSPSTVPTAGTSNPPDECVVIQVGPNNHAHCVERDSDPAATQSCMVTQSGGDNFALVEQSIDTSTSSSQTTAAQGNGQFAEVTQQPAPAVNFSAHNESQIHQSVKQTLTFGAAQAQDIHQWAVVTQSAVGAGNNFSHVHQAQDQAESGNGLTQDQNTDPTPADAPQGFATCTAVYPSTPNSCAQVTQTADSGQNESHLHQFTQEDQTSTGPATQTQGNAANGVGGSVHLTSITGTSRDFVIQRKQQHQSSNGGSQTQFDPAGCCGFSALGDDQSKEDLDQTSTQSAFGGTFLEQRADILGSANTPTGSCSVAQHVRQDAAATNASQTVQPCPMFALFTSCTTTAGGDAPTTGAGDCTTGPPPECLTGCIEAPVAVTPGTPTYGQPLSPMDFSEPTYTLPSWYVPIS